MADKNTVEQVAKLNYKPYTDGIKKIRDSVKGLGDSNKDLLQHERSWQSVQNRVKESAGSMMRDLKSIGKSIKENAINGLAINAGMGASNFARNAISQSAKSVLSFGEAMSRVQLKTGKTKDEIDDLQTSLSKLVKVGADLGSIPDAFDEIFSTLGDVDKSKDVLTTISGFSKGVEGRDAAKVARFVRSTLTSENLPVSKQNTEQLLGAVATMMKSGSFKTLDEAMGAYGALNANAISRAKISNKTAAQLLSAASGVANKDQSLAAVNEIMKGAGTGFAKNAVLNGLLGANLFKNGQLDTKELSKASERFKKKGYDDAGFVQLMTENGLSEDAANGLVNILKNADKFKEGIDKFDRSTTTAAQAGMTLGDNLSGKIEDIYQAVAGAFENLFRHLANFDFGKALGDVAGNFKEIAGATAAVLGGSAVTGMAAKRVLGMFGAQAAGAVAGGGGAAAAGGALAAEGAGVAGSGMLLGGTGLAAGALTATGVGVAGLAGYGIGKLANKGIDAYTQGTTSEGFQGNAVERLIFKLDQYFGGDASAAIKQAQKVQVEIQSKDPGFVGIPKANDNSRDPRGL